VIKQNDRIADRETCMRVTETKARNVRANITLWRVRATIVALVSNKHYML